MHAVLLAAGRGRRLGLENERPKCLLDVGGQTLLERHIKNLAEAGIDELTIVVGFQAQQIRDFVIAKAPTLPTTSIENKDFLRGSIVSLHVAFEAGLFDEGGIWMDADVLYPAALMRRLVTSPHENCVLLDRRSEETGEEMMLGVKDKRVRMIARKVSQDGPWDVVGEAVGFAKVGPSGAAAMKRLLATEIAAGRLDQEYEAAMNLAFKEVPWGFEPVDDFSWTEIDFQEDVEKARKMVAG